MKKIILLLLISVFTFSLFAQKKPDNKGRWLFKLNSADIGYAEFIVTVTKDKNGEFEARSAKGADKRVLGIGLSALARISTPSLKKGALVHIENGTTKQSGDTTLISAIFLAPWGSYYFNGTILNNTLAAKLTTKTGEERGDVTAQKTTLKTLQKDYSALIEKALATAKEKIYNGDLVTTAKWEKFEKHIRKTAKKSRDDIELVSAFFYRARKLGVSHFAFVRKDISRKEEAGNVKGNITLKELSTETVLMKIASFGGTAAEVDSVFAKIENKTYKNLIIDLRDNAGGSVAAGMRLASHLAPNEYYGGIFLTRKWFNTHKAPPMVAEYANFPHFTDANFNLIIKGVHEKEALCLKVQPVAKPYTGKVFILTNRHTASTCEPIVYGMKQYGLATIVGQKTAGAMLNGEDFDLGDGYTVIIPTADYYTADGYRIDQKGVKPTVEVTNVDALEVVLTTLIK